MRHVNQQEKYRGKLNIIKDDMWIRYHIELWCRNEEDENAYSDDISGIKELNDITLDELQNTLSENYVETSVVYMVIFVIEKCSLILGVFFLELYKKGFMKIFPK